MASARGGLVAGRVKAFEGADSQPLYSVPMKTQDAQEKRSQYNDSDVRAQAPLRPAPPPPTPSAPRLQHDAASTSYTTAEATELLIPLDSPPASINTDSDTAPAPLNNHYYAADGYAKMAKMSDVKYITFGPLPPTPPENNTWSIFRDYIYTASSRVRKASPWTIPSASGVRENLSTLTERFEKKVPMSTKRREVKFGLLIFLGIVLFLLIYKIYSPEPTEIDRYFHQLPFAPEKLLVYQGTLDEITEGNRKKCFVVEREKQSISNELVDVGVLASNEHITFPGSLLLANSHLVDNSPDVLVVERAPLTYTVNLPGLTAGSFTILPTFAEYRAAVNRVVNSWLADPTAPPVPTQFHSQESFAYSRELLRATFGLDFINSAIEAGINFDAMAKGERLIKMYKFTQVFYTVSVEPTKTPSHLFDPSVSVEEIKLKTDRDNPAVMVDTVSYGRKILVKLETSSLEKLAELNVTFFNKHHGTKIGDGFKNLNIQIYVFGGNSDHMDLIHVKSMDEVYDTVRKFGKFSKENLGFPISYSSRFITDNTKAIVHMSTDYMKSVWYDNCKRGVIKLVQRKIPTACKWEVTWTEHGYDEHGHEQVKRREWSQNSQSKYFSFNSESIEIPRYVTDLRVRAECYSIINSWEIAIDRTNIPVIDQRTFYIYYDFTTSIDPLINN